MFSGVRHPDFDKIHSTFMQHYSKDAALGEARYVEWVKLSGLDDSKGYYAQAAARASGSNRGFFSVGRARKFWVRQSSCFVILLVI